MKRSFFIAEVGVNHEGSIERAKEMILSAKKGGADCVKFQTYKADKLASRHSPSYWDTNSEPTTSQFELFQKFDTFNINDYKVLYDCCNDHYHAFYYADLKDFRQLEHEHLSCGNISEKRPTPNEDQAIRNARRSICAAHRIEKGQVLCLDDLVMKRPGFGVSPMDVSQLIGKVAIVDIPEDTLISMQMLN